MTKPNTAVPLIKVIVKFITWLNFFHHYFQLSKDQLMKFQELQEIFLKLFYYIIFTKVMVSKEFSFK